MSFTGVVIEESLADPGVLRRLRVVATKIEPVTAGHRTPWLTRWTLHTIAVADDEAATVAELLSGALLPGHWYADFKGERQHYVVFPGKVFVVERDRPEQYDAVVAHGLECGIPAHQLDFSPAIADWQRPAT